MHNISKNLEKFLVIVWKDFQSNFEKILSLGNGIDK